MPPSAIVQGAHTPPTMSGEEEKEISRRDDEDVTPTPERAESPGIMETPVDTDMSVSTLIPSEEAERDTMSDSVVDMPSTATGQKKFLAREPSRGRQLWSAANTAVRGLFSPFRGDGHRSPILPYPEEWEDRSQRAQPVKINVSQEYWGFRRYATTFLVCSPSDGKGACSMAHPKEYTHTHGLDPLLNRVEKWRLSCFALYCVHCFMFFVHQ